MSTTTLGAAQEIEDLRAENERLRLALDAAFILKNGEVYFRTSGGIPMQMPKATMKIVKAALGDQP